MKKFFSVFCVVLLLFTSTITLGSKQKVLAASAPALRGFKIIGYSDDPLLDRYGRQNYVYRDYYDAPNEPVHGASVYIVTRGIGYGNNVALYVDGNYYSNPNVVNIKKLTNDDGIYGFDIMSELDFIKPGKHTIQAVCTSENPVRQGTKLIYPTFSDSITLTVEAQ